MKKLILFLVQDCELNVVAFVRERKAKAVVFDGVVLEYLVLAIQFQCDKGVILEIEIAA